MCPLSTGLAAEQETGANTASSHIQPTRLPCHIDHVIAQQHGGVTAASNLALACYACNLHKGPNLSGRDPAAAQDRPALSSSSQQMGASLSVGRCLLGRPDCHRAGNDRHAWHQPASPRRATGSVDRRGPVPAVSVAYGYDERFLRARRWRSSPRKKGYPARRADCLEAEDACSHISRILPPFAEPLDGAGDSGGSCLRPLWHSRSSPHTPCGW